MLQIAQGEIREREVQIEAARADIRVKQNVRSLYKHRQPNTLSRRLCMSVSHLALYTFPSHNWHSTQSSLLRKTKSQKNIVY